MEIGPGEVGSYIADDPRLYILSVSGGKDSTATGLLLRERGIPFEAVHMATGWEHADTDRYVREILPDVLGVSITILSDLPRLSAENEAIATAIEQKHGIGPSAMVRWCLHKGMFPHRTVRFCTSQLKVYPSRNYARERAMATGRSIVSVQGIRSQESQARRALPEWEPHDGDVEVWRPIIRWSEADVIAMHRKYGVPPNPLYLRGASRVGCWPCIFSAKHDIRMIADTDPERIALLRDLEEAVGDAATKRAVKRGEELNRPPTFFQAPRRTLIPQEDGSVKRSALCEPIDSVVEWSRTKRGSYEFDPNAADPSDGGCVRWGVCEAAQIDLFTPLGASHAQTGHAPSPAVD